MYYIYMLRCVDNSIYTGVTTDIERRFLEHLSRGDRCAKYTKSHPVKCLEYAFKTENKVFAYKLEYKIKSLPKSKKEEIINNPKSILKILDGISDCSEIDW